MLVTRSCLTLCNPMDCSPPGSTVHGILQARILEWVAMPFSRGSSWPRDQTWVSCTGGRFFTIWATREVCGYNTCLNRILKGLTLVCMPTSEHYCHSFLCYCLLWWYFCFVTFPSLQMLGALRSIRHKSWAHTPTSLNQGLGDNFEHQIAKLIDLLDVSLLKYTC